jgi:hypothetical protein
MNQGPARAPGHWQRWHDEYADPRSELSRRLLVVQSRLREALDQAPTGPLTLVSACAGEGRDVVGALSGHPRAGEVRGRLVELDPVNADRARDLLAAAGLGSIEVLVADAGTTSSYAGAVPADLVLLCGIFGNVPVADIETTVRQVDQMCAEGATVIWTRHRGEPDLTPAIRAWFADSGFNEVAFDAPADARFAVGSCRLAGVPRPLVPGRRLFTFS